MKVSFDLDGTAWKYRRFFIELALALKVSGHEVGVITSHSNDLRAADQRLWAARGFPPPSFFYNAADMESTPGEHWRDRKLAFAATMGITAHIDDWDDLIPGQLEIAIIGALDESED